MKILRTGIVLGVLVTGWALLGILLGWHRDFSPGYLWLIIPLEIGILIWGLRSLASTSGYGRQIVNAVFISLVAVIVIFPGSLILTRVAFPGYLHEVDVAMDQMMTKRGLSETQKVGVKLKLYEARGLTKEQAKVAHAFDEPVGSSFQVAFGQCIGTVLTCLLASLVAAIWFRKR